MSRQPHKIRRLQTQNKNSKASQQVSESKATFLGNIRRILLEGGFIVLVIFGFGVLYNELHKPEIILEAIEVPEDLVKLGYTGKVLAQKLADESHKIQLDIKKQSAKNSWNKITSTPDEIAPIFTTPDISLPVAQITVKSLARFIRQEFGFDSTYIRGEIVHENKRGELSEKIGSLVLTLRKSSSRNTPPAEQVKVSDGNIETLLSEGGRSLLKLTSPLAMAVGSYHTFKNNLTLPPPPDRGNKYDEAVQAFNYCLSYDPKEDDIMAYTLWGIVLSDDNQFDEAIQKFRNAIGPEDNSIRALAYNVTQRLNIQLPRPAEDTYKAIAYNNWGLALLELKHKKEDIQQAIQQFQKAIAIDPKFTLAYSNWGNALRDLKHPEEAIQQYRKVIAIDPYYAKAYFNWSCALIDLKRPEEAIKQYQKATEIEQTYYMAYYNWGNALRDLKHPEEAIQKYQKTVEINPKYAYAYTKWGLALLQLNQPEEATEKFRKAISLESSKENAFMHEARDALKKLNWPEEKIENYIKTLADKK